MDVATPIRQRRLRGPVGFALGVAIGAIPLWVFLGTLGVAFVRQRPPGPGPTADLSSLLLGMMVAWALYLVMWLVAIALLATERTRVVGRGAFVPLVAIPIIGYLGWSVIPNLMR